MLTPNKYTIPDLLEANQKSSPYIEGMYFKFLLEGMDSWMKEYRLTGDFSLAATWKLPQAKFEKKQKNLIDYMHWKACWEDPRRMKQDPNRPYFTIRGREINKKLRAKKMTEWDFNA